MKIENTAVVVLEKEGKILLVKRANRTFQEWWCLPGGHAEKDETPLQNAQRESEEEIGQVRVEKKPFLIFVHDWPADSHIPEPHQHKCHAFKAKVAGDLRAGDDAGELGWFTLEEARKRRLVEYTRMVLDKLYPE
jgi:8-oxo-dGTP diphosphatase